MLLGEPLSAIKNIANSLGLKGPLQLVSVNTVVEKTSEHFQLVRFELQSATGTGEIIKVEEGLVSEKFNIPERCLPQGTDFSTPVESLSRCYQSCG